MSDLDLPALEKLLDERRWPRVQARRILHSFYADPAGELEKLQIGNSLIAWLRDNVTRSQSRIVSRHESADGTIKLLIGFDAGGTVEAVLMPSYRPDRAAACISSQIGCAMGCTFCASTTNGLERNLSSGEIVEQFLFLRSEASQLGRSIRSLVFMGMGEPMHNLENVLAAIPRIAEPGMGSVGYRNITVSTVGIVPGIDRLAAANLGVNLALSLHAPDDATRSRLVPSNSRWGVGDILDSARRFQERTGRVVNIEYCLLADVNDSDEQAILLARLLHGWRVHVNLIPYNSIGGDFRRPGDARIARFAELLQDGGAVAHVRVTRGDDISAACGQLRRRAVSLDQLTPRSAIGLS